MRSQKNITTLVKIKIGGDVIYIQSIINISLLLILAYFATKIYKINKYIDLIIMAIHKIEKGKNNVIAK